MKITTTVIAYDLQHVTPIDDFNQPYAFSNIGKTQAKKKNKTFLRGKTKVSQMIKLHAFALKKFVKNFY